jgi:SAM-dependent methyltransferase
VAAEAIDYGLDAPLLVKRMWSRAGWTIAFGVALFGMNRTEYPGPATNILIVFALMAAAFAAVGGYMTWSSKSAKLPLREQLVDSLQLTGEEKVLDAGCGLGLMTVGIAKRLKSGRVTGVDVWDQAVLSNSSADAAKANAKAEGVGDKVRFESGDVRTLVYPDRNFDVVVSALAIHNLDDDADRMKAVRELFRVLKPGGKLLILDTLHTGDYAAELTSAGAEGVTTAAHGFLWCLPTKSVRETKK